MFDPNSEELEAEGADDGILQMVMRFHKLNLKVQDVLEIELHPEGCVLL